MSPLGSSGCRTDGCKAGAAGETALIMKLKGPGASLPGWSCDNIEGCKGCKDGAARAAGDKAMKLKGAGTSLLSSPGCRAEGCRAGVTGKNAFAMRLRGAGAPWLCRPGDVTARGAGAAAAEACDPAMAGAGIGSRCSGGGACKAGEHPDGRSMHAADSLD